MGRGARTLVWVGCALLLLGAACVELGAFSDRPVLAQVGFAMIVLSGAGLAFLPFALGPTPAVGRILYWIGVAIVSLVDVPSVLDPDDLRLGNVLGPPGILALSAGLVIMWWRTRNRWLIAAVGWTLSRSCPMRSCSSGPTGGRRSCSRWPASECAWPWRSLRCAP